MESMAAIFRQSAGYVLCSPNFHKTFLQFFPLMTTKLVFALFSFRLISYALSNWSDFDDDETGVRSFEAWNFFNPNFKAEWDNGVWTNKFVFSPVVFCLHAANWPRFLLFFQFLSDLLNGFSNPFTVYSGSLFVWSMKVLWIVSGLVLLCFFTASNKNLFCFTSFCRFFDFMREVFWLLCLSNSSLKVL